MAVQEITFKDAASRVPRDPGVDDREDLRDIQGDKLVVNMGPSHPSTHGVLRVLIELDGETITRAVPDVGYLHRGVD